MGGSDIYRAVALMRPHNLYMITEMSQSPQARVQDDRKGRSEMDDDRSDEVRQLQCLRLVRAFLRIEDAGQRELVIDLAERLVCGAPFAAAAGTPTQTDGTPGDVLN
jgi:hypothetical protein